MTRLYKFASVLLREGHVTVLSEFLFDLLLQGAAHNYTSVQKWNVILRKQKIAIYEHTGDIGS